MKENGHKASTYMGMCVHSGMVSHGIGVPCRGGWGGESQEWCRGGGGGGCDVMVAHSLNVKHMTPPWIGLTGLILVLMFASCFLFIFPSSSLASWLLVLVWLLSSSLNAPWFQYFQSNKPELQQGTRHLFWFSNHHSFVFSTLLVSPPSINSILSSSFDGSVFVALYVSGTGTPQFHVLFFNCSDSFKYTISACPIWPLALLLSYVLTITWDPNL